MNTKTNLLNFGLQAMGEYMQSLGEPRFRGQQLIQWIHQRGVTDFDAMTNLSKACREKLNEIAEIKFPEVILNHASHDGTYKWLLKLNGGNAIETVFIPERGRGTLCVSSQVGCALNCSFCSTGKEGFNRNLNMGEIIAQVWLAVQTLAKEDPTKARHVTNVVMMGMGEPLLNYENVLPAMELMMHDLAYGLSKYRVTLSTSGVVPAMLQLKAESPVALAVSLHAATDELRNELVPINKKYPLKELMQVCRNYFPENSKRMVTFEYVMLKGINDTPTHAKQLIRLLDNMPCKMNLIPFNPFPKTNYVRSTDEAITAFQNRLTAAGINTWVRKTRGDDIDAACGQLAGQVSDKTGRHSRWLKTGRLVPEAKSGFSTL